MTTRPRPIASLLAVAAVCLGTLAGCAPGGGGSASGAASPGASSNATSSGPAFACFGETTGCAGPLSAGEHASTSFLVALTFTTPEGWVNVRDIRRTYGLETDSGLAANIEVMGMNAIAEQTDGCPPVPKAGVGSSVQDLIAAVQNHPGLIAEAPVTAEVDGFKGQSIDFSVAPNWGKHCPEDLIDPVVLLLTDTGNPPGRAIGYHIDERARWTVLDVHGETIIVELVGPPTEAAFRSSVAVVQPIVDSIRFGAAN